ncbi:PAS domain S-box protein [Chloroflexi bacterium TSY]|nr:PAS domain S-box protein [Chloroflexi bacterium TSY]
MKSQIFDEQIDAAHARLQTLRQHGDQSSGETSELLEEALRELSNTLHELQVTGEELYQQNQALATLQEALERERARYVDLFNFAPDGYLVTDLAGMIYEANRAASALFNVRQGFLVGQPLTLYVAAQDLQTFRILLADLTARQGRAGQMSHCEIRMQPSNAAPFYADLTVAIVYDIDGSQVALRWMVHDITKHKEAADTLIQERNLLRTLIDNLPDCIFVKDTQSRFVLNNSAHTLLVGAAAPNAVLGKTDFDFYPQRLAEKYYHDEQQIFETGQPILEQEGSVVNADGEERIHLVTKSPVYDPKGEISVIVGIARDITERKQMQDTLQHERDFLNAVVELASDGITVSDKQGNFLVYNRRMKEITGYSMEEAQRPEFPGVLYPDLAYRERAFASIESALYSERIGSEEWEMIRKDGEKRDVLISTRIFTHDVRKLMIGTVTDITRYKQAEAALQTSETHNRALVEAIPDAIVHFHRDGTILDRKPAKDLMVIAADERGVGQKAHRVYPADLVPIQANARHRALETGTLQAYEYELQIEGKTIYTETRVVPVGKDEVIAIVRNVTERKLAEKKYIQVLQEVEQQHAQLRALTTRMADMQEAEAKRLSQELHDQIGQNLTALSLNLNIVRSQVFAGLPEVDRVKSPLSGQIHARLDNALALVEQMTERVSSVMVSLRPPELDDYGLIAALKSYVSETVTWTGLTVDIQSEDVTSRLAAPIEQALFRIAQEALTNVVKHARATQVTVTLTEDDGSICMNIADNGCGIPSALLDGSAERQGWGLLIMQERAVAVGGRFHIYSRTGYGSSIIVEVAR